MAGYRLTKSAEADLRGVSSYTKLRWGKTQAFHYSSLLLKGLEKIAAGSGQFKDLSDLTPGLRMMRCEHHYLECVNLAEKQPVIVAILHDRMDLMAQLAGRLK